MNSGRAPHPYYQERLDSIVAEMFSNIDLSRHQLERHMPHVPVERLKERALEEIREVMRYLPYAGGDSGRMTPFFRLGAGTIAVGRALRNFKAPMETISFLMRRIFLAKIETLPESERLALGEAWLSEENRAFLRTQALASEQRQNPGDFVYKFVDGDSGDGDAPFTFGLDYSECGFCNTCHASGDADLLPNICAMDKESYEIRGVKLQRTTTLASGGKRCNFRFSPLDKKDGTS